MDNTKLEQIEALDQARPMLDKVIGSIENVIDEYSGNKKADTDEYMHSVLQGLEWVFAVYRSTKSLVNADGKNINQEEVNGYVCKLNEANKAQDDAKRAEAFEGILRFVKDFRREAVSAVAAA